MAHISSWSRTRDTTLIRGLNHGWNRTIVTKKAERAHIADDGDADVNPLKPETQDIEDVLVDADGEENKENEEQSFHDLSQHSSQVLSQEQNPDNEDGNDDEAIN